jgi:hypothetical protein
MDPDRRIGPVVAARREAFYTALETATATGAYVQGKHALEAILSGADDTEVTKHCCLGVATRVAMDGGLPLSATVYHDVTWFGREESRAPEGKHPSAYLVSAGITNSGWVDDVLHDDVVEWYRFPDVNPDIDGVLAKPVSESASECNDNLGYDFAKIAELFRVSYPADPESVV